MQPFAVRFFMQLMNVDDDVCKSVKNSANFQGDAALCAWSVSNRDVNALEHHGNCSINHSYKCERELCSARHVCSAKCVTHRYAMSKGKVQRTKLSSIMELPIAERIPVCR